MSPSATTLAEIDAVFHALAHETRRNVVLTLSHYGGELPSGYLARRFQHSWPTTTRHLGVLQRAGVVEVRREGRTSHYRVNRDLLQRVVGGWLDNLTPPTPRRQWTSSGPRSVGDLKRRAAAKATSKGKASIP
ncbi:MAG: helix-turn-helix transcriptional regulator [Chloroflexi bacterium]|nr:helix-turn-helix transcriptional regulator [Chloroflexota bacterium]MBV9134819.1 helix-turn-helix transcriptional regulator [Chloroflexota bacterium]MBV9897892.1 helix-turn-helix transcriptional regulator [Chloroflexota bacterium]